MEPRKDPSRLAEHKKQVFSFGQWRTVYTSTCKCCSTLFEAGKPTQKYCSRKCFFDSNRGSNNASWKGGRAIVSEGYVGIFSPNHPNKIKMGYMLEHRLLMEKYIGRYLFPEEVVHHINGNKQDNKLENLILFPSQARHQEYHGTDKCKKELSLR